MMTLRVFMRGYPLVLVSFITPQLLLQTDLILVALLGEQATAAYAIPMRVAMLDTVLMIAVSSVASVAVSGTSAGLARSRAILQSLGMACVLGVGLAIAGVLFYPGLARHIVADPAIAALASQALIWYALATPMRFLSTAMGMILHVLGEGRFVVWGKGAEVVLNALLNLLFIFTLSQGFVGSFQATLLVLTFATAWSLNRLRHHLPKEQRQWDWDWPGLLLFGKQCAWEGKRVLSGQLFALVCLLLFANSLLSASSVERMEAFSAGMALAFLLFRPFLSLMRFLSFRLAQLPPQSDAVPLQRLRTLGLRLTLGLAVLLLLTGAWLGEHLYGVSGRWWNASVSMVACSLPLTFLNALFRGRLQARQRFAQVMAVDALSTWSLGLPLVVAGLYWQSPWLTFSHIPLCELFALLLLQRRMPAA
ncbi:MAG: polysaccharide biosynthesis C-terminal domain-containing protein [Magnetococcales bacterium]|nr:polysaccharide biosynthesis C-terminal domain-containing protein [Magnetococcales bacterium]MBF0115810.1 polysaccharide biosynthesis C-terminal domain-containing protein [Magnetococcales bacterium]